MRLVCVHQNNDSISDFGEGDNASEAILDFLANIESDDDYEPGQSIPYEVREKVSIVDFMCKNLMHIYLDSILENLFDEVGFEDIWPDKAESNKLEKALIVVVKDWIRENKDFQNKWQCGDMKDRGVYVKVGKEARQ